jgi:hypothetical protein
MHLDNQLHRPSKRPSRNPAAKSHQYQEEGCVGHSLPESAQETGKIVASKAIIKKPILKGRGEDEMFQRPRGVVKL